MTRKQALLRALELLNTYGHPAADPREIREITAKLKELAADLPLTAWSEAAIFDAVDDWTAQHGRTPTTRDFSRKGLPPVPVLKHRFGLTGREFLDRYYPAPPGRCCSQRYGSKTAEEWRRIFIGEYRRLGPCTAREYNRRRDPTHPAWTAMARILEAGTWNGLLSACGFPIRPASGKPSVRIAGRLAVSRRVDTDHALAALTE